MVQWIDIFQTAINTMHKLDEVLYKKGTAMGAYVNPPGPDTSKEAWLEQYGHPIAVPPERFDEFDPYLPVCLVDNGPFTAAAIAFSQEELEVFTRPDPRPKQWYWVHIEDLLTVSTELEIYLNDGVDID